MKVGVDEAVNADVELCTVHDCPSYIGTFLADCVKRAAVHVKRKFAAVEGSNQ